MTRMLRLALAVLLALPLAAQLRPVGYHPSNVAYYNTPYFTNALFAGGEWRAFTGTEFGEPIAMTAPQFVNGYPQFLSAGQKLRAPLFGLHAGTGRDALAKGTVVVTWNGSADLRLAGCTLATQTSNRREYNCANGLSTLEVHAIGAPAPSQIRVWLPNTEGQLFHPLLLQRLADRDWAFIRFMDWGSTNSSPIAEWSDRTLPTNAFQTTVAYEHMVALCNASNKDLWINVPHLASADFMTRLAKLIRFGSDGVNPYDGPQAAPVFAPLNADRKIYVEYSNEIWSGGRNFSQGDWAAAQASTLGISKARFNARRFCDTWAAFENVFGGTERLIRVAATFTANDAYTAEFLDEIDDRGGTADVLAVTTYFGNGIQDYVQQQGFTPGNATQRAQAFDEWTRRILAGDATSGAGPDATGIGGGFSSALRAYGLPIVAYEGGPSLYTDRSSSGSSGSSEFLGGSEPRNSEELRGTEELTQFVIDMNRDPRIADVYRIHLELAKSKGLRTHTPYTDTSTWSQYGQWGHLETLDQNPASAFKYALMLEHFDTYSALRHIDAPIGSVPQFTTSATLPPCIVGSPCNVDVSTTGGTVTIIGASLDPGLALSVTSGALHVSGTPTISRKNYFLARVHDADGDPAWRVFTLETFGGPGTLVQSDFRGNSPALHRPWTPTYVLSPSVTWSGWTIGGAVTPMAGDGAFVFSVSGSQTAYLTATITPASAPLDLRGGTIRFATRRIGYHSPRRYALSANGIELSAGTEVSKDNFDEIEQVVTIPSTATFSSITTPLELRISAFGAEFDGHATSLTRFSIGQNVSGGAPSGLTATATSTTQIALAWSGGGMCEVLRDGAIAGSSSSGSFVDSVAPGTAHVYRVRSTGSGAMGNADLATAILFSDPLTLIRRTNVMQLRDAVNAVRAAASLPPATLTDPSITAGVTIVKAAHINELRSALLAALTTLGLPSPTFSTLTSPVRALHIEELRNAVR